MWRERKPTRCNNQMFIINFCPNMFRASLCPSSGEQRPCYFIWCTALVLLDVVGSGCGALRCRMLASYNAAPHNRNQPHPAQPAHRYILLARTTAKIYRPNIISVSNLSSETHMDAVDYLVVYFISETSILQRSAPQPLPTTSSRTSAVHHMQ